eukprot:gene9754-3086_t
MAAPSEDEVRKMSVSDCPPNHIVPDPIAEQAAPGGTKRRRPPMLTST